MVEQNPYPPKSLFVLFFKVGGTLTLIFVAWAAMTWFISTQSLNLAKRFAEEGEAAVALVAQAYTEKHRDSEGRNKTRYYLELEFTTRDGEEVAKKQKVARSEYDAVQVGARIRITYLRSEPQKVETSEGSNLANGRIARNLFYFSMLLVLLSVWHFGRFALDGWRARKEAEREEATLIKVKKWGWWIFARGHQLIWQDSIGRNGKSIPQKAEKLLGLRAGDKITVFRGKRRSWWAGDVGDR